MVAKKQKKITFAADKNGSVLSLFSSENLAISIERE